MHRRFFASWTRRAAAAWLFCFAGAATLQAQLIGTLDYSDTFTVAEEGGMPERLDGSIGTGSPAYDVENSHGNPVSTWTPHNRFGFNTGLGSACCGYPGNDGNPGAATGLAQATANGDFSFAYGLRTRYVVALDAILPNDRLDISSLSAPGNSIGSPGSISVFFRRDDVVARTGYPGIGVYKQNGPETAVTGHDGARVLTGITDALWHNFAVLFDQTDGVLKFFVDGASVAAIDLNTFGGGAYRNFSNAAVGAGGFGYDLAARVLWIDNFQVGAPSGATEACFSASAVEGVSPLAVDFDANCSVFANAPKNYTWDFGDGTGGSGPAVSHVFSAGGSYLVTLTVEDSSGATAAAQKTITVFNVVENFADDFERPDGPVDGWTVHAVPGAWNLIDGALTTGPTAEERWIWAGDPPALFPERLILSFDMSFLAPGTNPAVGRHAGAVFCANKPTHRYDPGFNGYTLGWIDRASDRGLWFMKVTNGRLPADATVGGGWLPEPPLEWRVEITATQILVYGDDVLYITVEDGDYRGGFAGLWTWSAGQKVAFDNYAVGPLMQALTAEFSVAPEHPMAGDPVTFDGTSSESIGGVINAYEWSFGDGASASGPVVTHIYASGGDYVVALTVRDGVNPPSTVERAVSVGVRLAPFADCFGRPEGPVDGWTATRGTWSITADGWVETDTIATGGEGFIYAGDPPRQLGPKFIAQVDWSFAAASNPEGGRHAGVHFYWNVPTNERFARDARGYSVFHIDRERDRGLSLYRWDYGKFITLNPPGGTPELIEPPSTLRIEVDGPAIRVFADGVLAIEAADETYRDGLFGLWVWNSNHVRFDNVLVGTDQLPSCDGTAETLFLRGDTNADGKHNIADAICLLGFLFGRETDPCKTSVLRCRDGADANNDGKIDIADAVRILGYLFTSATTGPLPEPFTACGPDPGTPADNLDCEEYPPCVK